MMDEFSPKLIGLVAALNALGPSPRPASLRAALKNAGLSASDLATYIREDPHAYHRQRIARTEDFELLLLTWKPGQNSGPHDHKDSLCAVQVLKGKVCETRFERAPDGLVDAVGESRFATGEILVDPGVSIHALGNAPSETETLVTLHAYFPPLPEQRRYAMRNPKQIGVDAIFTRAPHPGARRVAIVGGGFSGTVAAANLIALATRESRPLHLLLIDQQPVFGEGVAYRTSDPRHLLNVPAKNMSAWPDRPDDFLQWARRRTPATGPSDFLPRRLYGEYLRDVFFQTAREAGRNVSIELVVDEVLAAHDTGGGWQLRTDEGRLIDAEALLLAVGHRPPDDPLADRWIGSRARWINDPWSSLALSTIEPNQPVVILGSGLTAVDVLLSLAQKKRTAPALVLSRRGLFANAHAATPVPAEDMAGFVAALRRDSHGTLSARELFSAVRWRVKASAREGRDWRGVIDGLRPYTPLLWSAMPVAERLRFLRHVRAFWEIHRHRMAPAVAQQIETLRREGLLKIVAAKLLSAEAHPACVDVSIQRRDTGKVERLSTAWVINCTGPGAHIRSHPSRLIATLLDAGHLQADPLGLGVCTGPRGEALFAKGYARTDLVVIGTLRKPQLWETTAVPELRKQAAVAAETIMEALSLVKSSGVRSAISIAEIEK